MSNLPWRPALLTFAAVTGAGAALPAFAASPIKDVGGPGTLVPVVIWSLVGVLIAALVFGILYLFKKQVGGFPQPPSWIPPIDLMLSKDLPQDPPEEEHHTGGNSQAPAH